MSERAVDLTGIVPVYNEEESLPELHRRLAAALSAAVGDAWELVLVNDGSRDRSPAMLDALAARDPHCRILHFSRNFGHQVAASAGLDNFIVARLCRHVSSIA